MIVTIVHVKVKPEYIEEFIRITVKNHGFSVKEPGKLCLPIAWFSMAILFCFKGILQPGAGYVAKRFI